MGTAIEVGDHVTIGEADLTWEVLRFTHLNIVVLESGQTGRTRHEFTENLSIHTKAPANTRPPFGFIPEKSMP